METKKIRLIIAGSRDFQDYKLLCKKVDAIILDCLTLYPDASVTIVSGTARGADLLGERYAKEHGYGVKRFPADWNLYGKSAGQVRNRVMLDYAKEETGILSAFWDGYSRGTKNMIDIAKDAGISLYVTHVEI